MDPKWLMCVLSVGVEVAYAADNAAKEGDKPRGEKSAISTSVKRRIFKIDEVASRDPLDDK